jgi:hypothetical protein
MRANTHRCGQGAPEPPVSTGIAATTTKPKWKPPRAGMGRPKGAPNKFTLTLKEATLASFERVGGVDYLEKQARENPQAYMSLLAKVLPMQVTGANDGPIIVVTGVVRAGDDEPDGQTLDHEPVPAPRPLPEGPEQDRSDDDQAAQDDPEPDPPAQMRYAGSTRDGHRFREVQTAPPTHEGTTVVTESGMRIRSVRPLGS